MTILRAINRENVELVVEMFEHPLIASPGVLSFTDALAAKKCLSVAINPGNAHAATLYKIKESE